ncbi:MAG: DUF4041 domain-containing protein, partial [Clostridia bacterium]|nr:DUF4041 domain-containing protein [Clostridia bacterium]
MGLLDIFNASKIKEENSRLAKELEIAKSKLTPRMLDAILLEEHINELKATEFNLSDRVRQTASSLSSLEKEIKNKRKMLVDIDDEILYQEFALYKPKYDFANSDQYKERLAKIRDQQKAMIKNEIAIVGNINWTVDGSKAKGAKMVRDIQKLLLRAFNSECDEVVSRVSYANFDSSKSRIEKSYQSISNLGKVMKIEISYSYLQLKIQELTLAFEYKQKKQEEKEEQKILKAQLREEAKLQKEIEETRKKILKEQQHYQNALNSLNKKIENASDLQLTELLNKKAEIE